MIHQPHSGRRGLSRVFISAILIVVVVALLGAYFYFSIVQHPEPKELKIFHAGSLGPMLAEAESKYEAEHPNVDILRESGGSVASVRKITDLGKKADIVMVADVEVIPAYLMPKYADWAMIFASNEVVLTYTDKSKRASEINGDNWYEVLQSEGVKFGFSNPNLDPCGYRSLAVLYMASKYYGREGIWTQLVKEYIRNVDVKENDSGAYILFPANPDYVSGGKLVLRDKSVELVQLVESGVLDYAFEYKNVAKEHGLKYIELPKDFSLSQSPSFKVHVVLYHGDKEREKAIKIDTINYGLTIPLNAENPGAAKDFVKWLIYGEGSRFIEEHGFIKLKPSFIGNVPEDLRG